MFLTLFAIVCIALNASAALAEVVGSLGGVAFKPAAVKLAISGEMTVNDVSFDTYQLTFMSKDDIFAPQQASVTFVVPKGKLPDGRSFSELPDVDVIKQPSVVEGLPEVQGWLLEDKDNDLRLSHISTNQANLQVELGKRQGTTISGKIKLSVPALSEDGRDFKASSLKGDFTAVIETE